MKPRRVLSHLRVVLASRWKAWGGFEVRGVCCEPRRLKDSGAGTNVGAQHAASPTAGVLPMFTHNEAIAIRAYRASKRKRVRNSWVAFAVAFSAAFFLWDPSTWFDWWPDGYTTGGWPVEVTERVPAGHYG